MEVASSEVECRITRQHVFPSSSIHATIPDTSIAPLLIIGGHVTHCRKSVIMLPRCHSIYSVVLLGNSCELRHEAETRERQTEGAYGVAGVS